MMGDAVKVGAGVVGVLVSFIVGLLILAGGTNGETGSAGAICAPTGPVPTLSASQASNAEIVVASAESFGAGDRGAQIALMTAYTESSLENIGSEPDNDGSLGLFQQRAAAGWGTPAEEQDPTEATSLFIGRLLAVPDWQSIAPWVAAQDVQRSAFDGGSNYEANWTLAGTFLTVITALTDTQVCGGVNGAEPAGPASSYGLPLGYAIPTNATPAETLAITYAISKLGDAYVWGAAGPNSFDCSGLTMMAWAQAGVPLDHFTGDQINEGFPVDGYAAISPGDLVLIPGSDGTLANPGHVGIYIGYGLVLSATDPEQGVIVQTWANFTAGRISGIRQLG
jgi:cell wall-associated NlpC family hydrolase